ncbi:MAG: hypothetical protein ACI92G_003107 [Candidatus Pelagisphaera sp.]|jgi:hypothetical protein
MSIMFRPSQPDEAAVLSDIAIESKGHWGYSREQLEVWRKDLRILPSYIKANTIETIWQDELKVGFFAIKLNPKPILDHLWLLPKAIGHGIGKLAFQRPVAIAEKTGSRLSLSSPTQPRKGSIFTWELNASEKSPVSRRIECCQNYSTGSKSNKICPQTLA